MSYQHLPPHPDGDEQFVIRWNRSSRQWERWYFTTAMPTINRFTDTPDANAPDAPYLFTPEERARLALWKPRFGPWYTDDLYPPHPTPLPSTDPPGPLHRGYTQSDPTQPHSDPPQD